MRFSIALVWLTGMLWAGLCQAQSGSAQQLRFSSGGLPDGWAVCVSNCVSASPRATQFYSAGQGMRIVYPDDAAATARLDAIGWQQQRSADTDGRRWISESAEPELPARVYLHAPLERSRGGAGSDYRITVELSLPPGAVLEIATGPQFVPEALPGFGAFYSNVSAVQVTAAGQEMLDPDTAGESVIAQEAGDWFGIRSRFWAWLWQPQSAGVAVELAQGADNQPVLRFAPPEGSQRLSFSVYAGPVERAALETVAPELTALLFAASWDWLRLLCIGMLLLLEAIHGVVGNYGVAIIILSLLVKILMWPLTRIADRWQAQVNETQIRLKPALDEIKANFKGEEAHNRTLAVYREHGVHPMYTLKSLAGLMIQIPVFIAAFNMLGENFGLGQAGFLWIEDLAKPDRWALLPWAVPFFGQYLNMLPFVMTVLSALAARVQQDSSLSAELMRSQQTRLYLMAAAFFLLFYTFPAGMVLYWASNNLFYLCAALLSAFLRKKHK